MKIGKLVIVSITIKTVQQITGGYSLLGGIPKGFAGYIPVRIFNATDARFYDGYLLDGAIISTADIPANKSLGLTFSYISQS